MRLVVVTIFALFSIASAAVYNVSVGKGGLVYDPSSLTGVKSGDVIHFQFGTTTPHSVTQSTFDSPCATKPQGTDSGVRTSSSSNPDYPVTIDNVTSPLWYYCTITGHCSSGMVFAINPTTDQTYDAFKAKAMGKSVASSGSAASPTSVSSSSSAAKPTGSTSGAEGKSSMIQKTVAVLAGAVLFIGLFI